jgi:cytochrome b involved in lipid metabolism
VYDVTAFTKEHPGGEKLLRGMGSAPPEYIEEQFMSRHMHSKAARNMLDMMIIGRLAPQQG